MASAMTLEQLTALLNAAQSYTPLTEEQIRQQAERRYQEQYSQRKSAALASYQADEAALLGELARLRGDYAGKRAQSKAEYGKARADTDRAAIGRGMQRSSYLGATLANIDLNGLREQSRLDEAQTEAEGGVQDKRTQRSSQFSQQLAQYDEARRESTLAYIDQLRDREYSRAAAAEKERRALAAKLYEYQRQSERDALEQARWEANYNARYGR